MVTGHLPAELHLEVPRVGTLRRPWEEVLISRMESMVPKILAPLLWIPLSSLRPITDRPGEFWNTDGGSWDHAGSLHGRALTSHLFNRFNHR